MLNSNINKINFSLLECQVEILLRALELYGHNLHFCYYLNNDYEQLNSMLFYTYESILSVYSRNQYSIGYNLIKECPKRSKMLKIKNFKNSA